MGHLPLTNTEDSSVMDASVRDRNDNRPGRADVSEMSVAPTPSSSPCDDGAVCTTDGESLTLQFSAEACAELPLGCDTGGDPKAFRYEL